MTEKGRPREYTQTHMGIHEDRVFPINLDAVYLNKEIRMGYETILSETTSKEKSVGKS
jgi:hypothetical protein